MSEITSQLNELLGELKQELASESSMEAQEKRLRDYYIPETPMEYAVPMTAVTVGSCIKAAATPETITGMDAIVPILGAGIIAGGVALLVQGTMKWLCRGRI